MGALILPLPSGRAGRRSRAVDRILAIAAGLRDGLRMLRRYQELTDKSDVQLARIGVKRENIPNVLIDRR